MNKIAKFWTQLENRFFPQKNFLDEQTLEPQVEISSEERRAKFRSFLTDKVSAGWRIEIENEFDAVISRKIQTGWFGKFLIFVLLLLIFLPLAIFYLIYVIVKGVQGKQKLLRVWIDIYGNIKTN